MAALLELDPRGLSFQPFNVKFKERNRHEIINVLANRLNQFSHYVFTDVKYVIKRKMLNQDTNKSTATGSRLQSSFLMS